jgi:Abortive infection alpha
MSIVPSDIVQLIDPAVQNKIYDDLFSSAMSEVGDALSTVVCFVKSPVYLLKLGNEYARLRFEKCMRSLQNKFDDAGPDMERCKLSSEIAQPILEELLIVDNEQIREMFIQLLAKAAFIKSSRTVHRGFATTLREMVPDEAIILKASANNKFIPFVRFMYNKVNPHTPPLTGLEEKLSLEHKDCISLYLDNLRRVGIFNRVDGLHYQTTDRLNKELVKKYRSRAGGSVFDEDEPFTQKTGTVFWERGYYEYTEYGKLFHSACCNSLCSSKNK